MIFIPCRIFELYMEHFHSAFLIFYNFSNRCCLGWSFGRFGLVSWKENI